jgi:fibronectin-binding autotransporter adhesin
MNRKMFGAGRSRRVRRSGSLALAAGPVMALLLPASKVAAQTLVWDPANTGPGTGVPADGSGTWDTSSSDWYNATPPTTGGSDVAWNNGDTAQFGNAYTITNGLSGTAGTVNLATNITATGIVFDPTNAGNYTINTGANTLAIGTGGLSVNGGAPTINLGNTNMSIGGAVTVGPVEGTTPGITTLTGTLTGSLTISGTGTTGVSATAGNFEVGSGPTASIPSPGTTSNVSATLNMSGLKNFSYNNSGGTFAAGIGLYNSGAITLATNSTINANAFAVGDSDGNAGGLTNGFQGNSSLSLGTGTNTIDATFFSVGGGLSSAGDRASGTLNFSTNTGTLTVAGVGGSTNGPTLTIGVGGVSNGNGGQNVTGAVSLDGHLVTLTFGAATIGDRVVSGVAGQTNTITGSLSFDDGTVSMTTITALGKVSGGSSVGDANGTINVGGSSNSATLNVNTAATSVATMNIGQASGAAAGSVGHGTINILTNGTANIQGNLTTSAAGLGSVNLNGGTLNMLGGNIGTSGMAGTVTFTTTGGTLENVAGIFTTTNVPTGVTMATVGNTLTIAGNNGWSGPTNVNAGTVILTPATILGDTAITISNSATMLASAGVIAGNTNSATGGATVTLQSGGTLSLADGTVGNFSVNQGASFTGTALALDGGTIKMDLGPGSPALDEVVVNQGNIDVEGSNTLFLSLVAGTTTLTPGTYNLFATTSGAITGETTGGFAFSATDAGFTNVNSTTDTVTLSGGTYTLTLTDPGGVAEAINIVAVPEPVGIGMLGLGGLAMLSRRRTRSTKEA